jgi:HSP20 family protein
MSNNSLMHSLLGRWPARDEPVSRFQNDIDRVFEQFRDWVNLGSSPLALETSGNRPLVPRTDVSETDTAIEVDIDLPGVQLKDVDVSVVDKVLMVTGSKSESKERDEKNYHIVERSQGSFSRQIPLGFDVDTDKVQANFKNGVLHITLEKPAEVANSKKKIEVRQAEEA